MIRKRIVFLQVVLFWGLCISAQQTFYNISPDQDYIKAVELYSNGKYSAAQLLFDQYIRDNKCRNADEVSNSEYYSAMCAVKLFNNDAESRVSNFISNNPENPHGNDAVFSLANYYYQLKSYNRALDSYEKVDKTKLSKEDQGEYYFKSGYCYFLKNDPDKARFAFSQIKDLDTKYTAPALYYYSHINYAQGNYETALEGFQRLKDDENFGPIVPYYLTQIYYKQKKYDEVVKYAPSLMQNVTEKRTAEVARIIGESYVQLGRYSDAIPYLEKFMETASSMTKEDKYSVAYAYYKTGDYNKASKLFGDISSGDSELSQNALYHLADCELKLGDKNQARMAFSSASKMDYDKDIREDALFNYALLTYELDYSPFNEAVQALNDYLNLYPNSKRSDEASNYLVMAYMNAKNYKLALASIDKIRNKTSDMKKAYQKIAYYRAMELFGNQDFNGAIDLLNSSVKYGVFDNQLYTMSYYWKGEAYYRLGDYDHALDSYNSFLAQPDASKYPEYLSADYNLGYCYFSKKQYTDATTWFSKYINTTPDQKTDVYADALNRLGDCYFVQSNFASANNYYDRAIQSGKGNMDYSLYQKGLTLGVSGKNGEALTVLNQLLANYPNSAYRADAIYQSAENDVKLGLPDKAIPLYKKITTDYPNSSYVKKSLVSLGLLYYNSNRNADAIQCYKKVISDYPGSDEAQNALLGLKNVYVDNNDVDSYYSYIATLGILTSADAKEQDSLSYLAAEKVYMSGDCPAASTSLKNYIDKHPNGRFLLDANFYYGDCSYKAKQDDAALSAFNYIISKPKNTYTEPALLGASRIKFMQKDYAAALDYYRKLEAVAEIKSNLLEARFGMLNCYYQTGDYENVIDLADKILLAEKLSPDMERQIRFMKAKALLANDRQMLALDEFKKVATDVKTEEGAESKFRIAEIYYKRQDLANAEKEISDFADKTTPYQYWMAKSFLLWADIYADRGNYFQAIQTVQSLIDYYENSDDGILAEAKAKKELLVAKQEKNQKPGEQQDVEIQMKDN